MRARIFAALLCVAMLASPSFAQTTPQTPTSLRLTGEQWACLQSRLPNLRRLRSDVVRVPLSPCNQGAGVRGAGNTNPTSARSGSTAGSTPRAPLYLSKQQLNCIERRLPELTRGGSAEIDLTQC